MDAIINKYGVFGGDYHRSIEFGGTSGEHTIIDLLLGMETNQGAKEKLYLIVI